MSRCLFGNLSSIYLVCFHFFIEEENRFDQYGIGKPNIDEVDEDVSSKTGDGTDKDDTLWLCQNERSIMYSLYIYIYIYDIYIYIYR